MLQGHVLQVLMSAMNLARRCRVNAALTIQLFSQLFHYINQWLFNRVALEPRLQLCTRDWGRRLKHRLGHVEVWAEKQGLELAADCHLSKILQVLACCFSEIAVILCQGYRLADFIFVCFL